MTANDGAKVRDLLKRNADPNVKNPGGGLEPVLGSAALLGNLDIVRALVEAGAGVEATTVQGNSPLLLAALKGHAEVVKYLLHRIRCSQDAVQHCVLL